MAKIGLKEAIQAAYEEMYAAVTEIPLLDGLNFIYRSIEMEFTVEMGQATEKGGGVKVWVVEGAAKGTSEERKTHTVRLTIEPRGRGDEHLDIGATDRF